jgi:hypothetical protein
LFPDGGEVVAAVGLLWHRELRPGDVQTAHQLLNQHAPYLDRRGARRCANALHAAGLPAPHWPCCRAEWAYEVLAAEERGEVGA